MKKYWLVGGLVMISGLAAAQEVGKVLSSTPITRDVGVQQKQCAPDANPRDPCRSVTTYEKRTVGYKVVYEYAGKQYTAQMAEDPGATVSLQISPAITNRPATSAAIAPVPSSSAPVYEERWDADRDRPYRVIRSTEGWDADRDRSYSTSISSEPRYVERVYIEPTYYAPSPYYYPAHGGNYGAPLWPLVGLSIGLAAGYRSYGGYYRGSSHSHWHGRHRGPRGW